MILSWSLKCSKTEYGLLLRWAWVVCCQLKIFMRICMKNISTFNGWCVQMPICVCVCVLMNTWGCLRASFSFMCLLYPQATQQEDSGEKGAECKLMNGWKSISSLICFFMLNLCVFKLELKCLTKLLLKTRVYERETVCVNCQCSGEQKMRALSQPYVCSLNRSVRIRAESELISNTHTHTHTHTHVSEILSCWDREIQPQWCLETFNHI